MAERKTSQKAAIFDVLREATAPLGIGEILARAQILVPGLSQATVYRVLKSLIEKDAIVVLQLPGESSLYEVTGKKHHHFFRCRRCEKMYEVEGCTQLIKQLVPRGFKLEDHEVYLLGLCNECA